MSETELPDDILHYHFEKVLGRGGMGVVYLAQDMRLQRLVAIKCLDVNVTDEALTERLRREAKVLAQLNHPNIVQVYDFIDDGQTLALVMEYVQGQTLLHHLKERQCHQRQQLEFIIQIGEALCAAHQQGVIHRDLKLDNVLVGVDGQLKLSDFGIARSQEFESQLTQHDAVSGSYNAMSPEQIRGEQVGPASDLFSFGVLMFRVLAGVHPFGEESGPLIMLDKILNQEPQKLSALGVDVPPVVAVLIAELLNKKAQERPSSAEEVLTRLRSSLTEASDELGGEMTAFDMPAQVHEPQSTKPPLGWGVKAAVLVVCSLAIYLGYGLLKDGSNLFAKPSLYVAVLPPELEALDKSDYSYLRQAVYYALQDGVIELENLNLISADDVEEVGGDTSDIGLAVGADVVLQSRLECSQQRCRISISKLTGPDWSMGEQKRSTLINEKLLDAYKLVFQSMGDLFQGREGLLALSDTISEENYQRFIDLNIVFQVDESRRKFILDELDNIQQQAPKFEALYGFYTTVALDAFVENYEGEYQTRLKALLEKGSSELPNSILMHRHWFEYQLHSGEEEKAMAEVDALVAAGAEEWDREYLLALAALQAFNYQSAIDHFEQSIQLRPSAAAYRNLGTSYWSIGARDEAIAALNQGLNIAPEHIGNLNTLSLLYLTGGQLDQAQDVMGRLLERAPTTYHYMNLGLVLMLKREYQRAEVYFLKAQELSPKNPICVLNLADNYMLMGQEEKAKDHYKWIIAQTPNDSNWSHLRDLSQAYIHTGQTLSAYKAMEKSQVLAPDNNEVAYSSALVYARAKDYPSALLWTESALEQGMDTVWFSLSWFDDLCESPEYGVAFGQMVGRECNP